LGRRGILGEIIHQSQIADQRQRRANQAAYAAAQREKVRQEREAARAAAAASRANARTAAEDEKARKLAHIADQEARVEELNEDLERKLEEILDILEAGLKSGGYIDPVTLRTQVVHPEFESIFQKPIAPPAPIVASSEPVLVLPESPKGLSGLFKKNEHAVEVSVAQKEFEKKHLAWQAEVASIPLRQMEQMSAYATSEEDRLRNLEADRATYDQECAARQKLADESNAKVTAFIEGLKSGQKEAVEEYLDMVFEKSEYPENIEPISKCDFDPNAKELRIDLSLPRPINLPQIKNFKYVKSGDSINEVAHTAKESKDLYSFVVCAITLRVLHETFDADRDENISSISFVGGVQHLHEGLGKEVFSPLIHVAVSRETFKEIVLSKVVPMETLKYLGAVVSKNLYGLEPANVKAGMRSI
jgi:restriction system protein